MTRGSTTVMDLLCRAYADDEEEGGETLSEDSIIAPPSKRHRSQEYHHRASYAPSEPPVAPARYISKRERSMLAASVGAASSPHQARLDCQATPVVASPVSGTISNSDLPHDVLQLLRSRSSVPAQSKNISGKVAASLSGHSRPVRTIQWSSTHAHLLASAGMDQKVHVWNVWSKDQKKARIFDCHHAAIKDVRWSPEGLSLLSCGYDCSSRLVDVDKGVETQNFKEDQIVEAVRFHPSNPNLFLSGGSKGFLRLWDIRVGKVVQNYVKSLGPILDIEFRADAKHFLSSSDTTGSNISENAVIVWDVSRQVPLSNQVYTEAFTCPCTKYHPSDACFVAQSNGNYIAIFSARAPFKLDRYKRYQNHGVWGYPIKCDFSLDGSQLASGSSDGFIYIYSYRSAELLKKVKAFDQPCIDVSFHPVMPNVIASCCWTGEILVFE